MKRFLLASLFLFSGTQLLAQDDGEVIVIADLNRAEVRQFIAEAEDQFYGIFNANIEDEDFKITCRRETPTGSNIAVRVCEPEFLNKARADNMASFQFNRGTELTDASLRSQLEPEFTQLQAMMEEMAQTIPEFAQIASILTQLRARQEQLAN